MQTAKLFTNGDSQAVRLPAAFKFDGDSVFIRRDENGDVVLSARPRTWDNFIAAASQNQDIIERDIQENWTK
ncbi:MAG: AbrB/MazE/SpoVT family DNA-binding domain-containing protein [Neisseria sp.]|nr:AbrB/MazE/SpoVT family DNA-binding domain-containing protein [Neisseria sp.]